MWLHTSAFVSGKNRGTCAIMKITVSEKIWKEPWSSGSQQIQKKSRIDFPCLVVFLSQKLGIPNISAVGTGTNRVTWWALFYGISLSGTEPFLDETLKGNNVSFLKSPLADGKLLQVSLKMTIDFVCEAWTIEACGGENIDWFVVGNWFCHLCATPHVCGVRTTITGDGTDNLAEITCVEAGDVFISGEQHGLMWSLRACWILVKTPSLQNRRTRTPSEGQPVTWLEGPWQKMLTACHWCILWKGLSIWKRGHIYFTRINCAHNFRNFHIADTWNSHLDLRKKTIFWSISFQVSTNQAHDSRAYPGSDSCFVMHFPPTKPDALKQAQMNTIKSYSLCSYLWVPAVLASLYQCPLGREIKP